MRLVDLNPYFFRCAMEPAGDYHGRPLPDGSIQWGGFPTLVLHTEGITIDQADGVGFHCPLCFQKNGGPVRTHKVLVPFMGRNAPPDFMVNRENRPVRWNVSGTGFQDLTTTPSILLLSGCNWHGFITNGDVSII